MQKNYISILMIQKSSSEIILSDGYHKIKRKLVELLCTFVMYIINSIGMFLLGSLIKKATLLVIALKCVSEKRHKIKFVTEIKIVKDPQKIPIWFNHQNLNFPQSLFQQNIKNRTPFCIKRTFNMRNTIKAP